MNTGESNRERGIALVAALLILMVVALLAMILMQGLLVETTATGLNVRTKQALNIAEAGIGEAMARIRSGDVPDDENPRMVCQIFLAPQGSVPVLGADSVALATAQPNGQWLDYSRPIPGPEVLTVTYKTDAARTQIYRYDEGKDPRIQPDTGLPIYVISSTGRKGNARNTVVAEMVGTEVSADIWGAVVGREQVQIKEQTTVCGYNHRKDTPTGTAADAGRSGTAGSCNEDPSSSRWEKGAEDRVGSWAGNQGAPASPAQVHGTPFAVQEHQGRESYYQGPWDPLRMTQPQFYSFLGPRQSSLPAKLEGVVHYDNNAIGQDQSAKLTLNGNRSGEGFLYVDGDLEINGNFTFRGLIYAEGSIQSNGKLWVLGAMVSTKECTIGSAGNGSAILYSKDAISEALRLGSDRFVTLSWREVW